MSFIFISYARENTDFLAKVEQHLSQAGIKYWTDKQIGLGKDWKKEIDEAIRKSAGMLLVMSKYAQASEYVTYEWSFAAGNDKPILPMIIDDVANLHPKLKDTQFLTFTVSNMPWNDLIIGLQQQIRASSILQRINSENAGLRRQAIRDLEQLSDPAYVEQVTELLHSDDKEVYLAALKASENLSHESLIAPLLQALSSNDTDVKIAALKALQSYPENHNVRKAVLSVLDEDDRRVRMYLSDVFEAWNDLVIDDLHTALLNDGSHRVRETAADILGDIRNFKSLPFLVQGLDDKDDDVRRSSQQSIEEFGIEALDALRDVLRANPNSRAREAAADILRDGKYIEVVPDLILSLDDNDKDVRAAVGWALRDIGLPAFDSLIKGLDHSSPHVREGIVDVLRQLKASDAVSHLINRLEDEDDDVRRAAIWALRDVGLEASKHLIDIEQFDQKIPQFREATIEILRHLKTTEAVRLFVHALNDNDSSVRNDARRALVDIGVASVDYLSHVIQQGGVRLRISTIEILADLRQAQGSDVIRSALEDKHPEVRKAAFNALALVDGDALSILVEYLNHDDPYSRVLACEALGDIGDPVAVPKIQPLLNDIHVPIWSTEDKPVCDTAKKALIAIGTDEAIDAIIHWNHKSNSAIESR